MKNKGVAFDRKCHVLYSKACEKEIKKKIALHYHMEKREQVWTEVQLKYSEYLRSWRTDLGGKQNFHNGKGGTYDCIAIMTYYDVCKSVTDFREIEEREENLILPSLKKLKFVNCNKPFWKRLMYQAFKAAKGKCDKWHDYERNLAPYAENQPIYYEFTSCPAAEFAKQFGLTEIMPALCNVDFKSMELIRARLIRTGTCVDGKNAIIRFAGMKTGLLMAVLNMSTKKGSEETDAQRRRNNDFQYFRQ